MTPPSMTQQRDETISEPCWCCTGRGTIPAITSGETRGAAKDAERQRWAENNPITCPICGGTGKSPSPAGDGEAGEIEAIAKIIDPEAFGLPNNIEADTITDRDEARDRARLVMAALRSTQPPQPTGVAQPTEDVNALSEEALSKIENIRRQAKAWAEIASDEEAAPTGSMLAAVNSLLIFLDKRAAIIDRLSDALRSADSRTALLVEALQAQDDADKAAQDRSGAAGGYERWQKAEDRAVALRRAVLEKTS